MVGRWPTVKVNFWSKPAVKLRRCLCERNTLQLVFSLHIITVHSVAIITFQHFISHSDSVIVGLGKLSCWPVMPNNQPARGRWRVITNLVPWFPLKSRPGCLYREVTASCLDVFHLWDTWGAVAASLHHVHVSSKLCIADVRGLK